MSRLIDAERLKREFPKDTDWEYPVNTNEYVCEVIDAQPTVPQWIPVTERLPEKGIDVLVTRKYDGREDGHKSCCYVEVASCFGQDDGVTWNSYSDEYKMHPRNHSVIAWMPLPEPYKKG